MTKKRFTVDKDGRTILDSIDDSYCECVDGYEAKQYCDKLNELNEENSELKNSLNEFEVFESNRIKGAVVTNDDFSVTLHNNNEAYMVCNMINRFIRSVKND